VPWARNITPQQAESLKLTPDKNQSILPYLLPQLRTSVEAQGKIARVECACLAETLEGLFGRRRVTNLSLRLQMSWRITSTFPSTRYRKVPARSQLGFERASCGDSRLLQQTQLSPVHIGNSPNRD